MTARTSPSRTQFLTIALVVALIGVVLSAMLVCKHEGICSSGVGCTIGGIDGCSELGKSRHSRLFGVGPHIAWLGFYYYAFVAGVLALLRFSPRLNTAAAQPEYRSVLTMLVAAVTFGFVMDLYLAYMNFFVLIVPCLFCAYTYLCQTALLALVGLLYFREREGGATPVKDVFSGLLHSWIPAAVGVGAMVVLYVGLVMLTALDKKGQSTGEVGADWWKTSVAGNEQRTQALRELDAFRPVQLSTAGLVNADGEAQAYIQIHDFADFRCPHCRHTHEILRAAQSRWPGRIRVYYRHFPLDKTCNRLMPEERGGFSCNGALASLCAPEQKLFPQLYHEVFQFQVQERMITAPELERVTRSLGGDWSRLVSCMGSARANQLLKRDVDDSVVVDVQSTPTLVVQGHVLPGGTPDVGYLFAMLDALVLQKEGEAALADFEKRAAAGQIAAPAH